MVEALGFAVGFTVGERVLLASHLHFADYVALFHFDVVILNNVLTMSYRFCNYFYVGDYY